jgi:hypothetical protein
MDARSRTRRDVGTVIDQDFCAGIYGNLSKDLCQEENVASREVTFADLYHINSRFNGTLRELN